jgi:RHS repeat-associated protein
MVMVLAPLLPCATVRLVGDAVRVKLAGAYGFAYDNMGRVIGTTTQYSFLPGYNFQNGYAYDAASNRNAMTAPDGSTVVYSYDTLNRMNTLTSSLMGQFGFGYDALSRRTQLTRPNGVTTNYSYDAVSDLLSILHQTGSTTLDGSSYGFDYAGNRTSNTNYLASTTSTYGYDALYELLSVSGGTTESYGYDPVGNRLSSAGVPSCSYNPSNELVSSSNGSYTYDANGNTLTDAAGKQYTWDFENRLTQVVVPGTGTVSFKYDPFGRRVDKSSPSFAGSFAYDGFNLIETVNSTGTILARYTMTQNVDEPLAMMRSNGSDYYEADGMGSITSLTSSTGSIANTYTYDSFGNMTNSTGSVRNPFVFAGREYDSETNLYFNRARYYNPSTGRFISEDPIRFWGGMNFYGYVYNSPGNFIDPLGLCGKSAANNDFTLGVRASGQTYSQCLAANSANYSLAGAFNQDSGTAKLVAGNDVASLLFGDASEGQAGLLLEEGGAHSVSAGIGTVGTMGRRTASVFDLNLAGTTGRAPAILAKTGAEKLAGWLTGVAELKFAGDVGGTGALMLGCLIHR